MSTVTDPIATLRNWLCGHGTRAVHAALAELERRQRIEVARIGRARSLYVDLATRPERERLRVAELQAENLLDRAHRTRVLKSLPELRKRLVQAVKTNGEIFDEALNAAGAP